MHRQNDTKNVFPPFPPFLPFSFKTYHDLSRTTSVSSQENQQHHDRHKGINEVHLDVSVLHSADPAGQPEAGVNHRLIYPTPESVPYPEMVIQSLREGRMCRRRKLPHALLDIEKISEDPAQGHGKGCGGVLHPAGDLFKTAVPERHPVEGPGTGMEQ